MFHISVLLDVQANLPKTSPFFSAQMALVSMFFQMLQYLGCISLGVMGNEENFGLILLTLALDDLALKFLNRPRSSPNRDMNSNAVL